MFENISLVSQIIGALAVIASLVFVGRELSQNAMSMRIAAYQAAQERLDSVRHAIISDANVIEMYSQGLDDPLRLDDRQLVQFRLLLFVIAGSMQTLHVMFVQSNIDASEWNRLKPTALRIFGTAGGRAWLALFKHEIDPKFAEALNDLLKDTAVVAPPSRADWQAALTKGA